MFNRTVELDNAATEAVKALDAVYKGLEGAINTLPEGRAQLFAHSNLAQSYFWAVQAVEEDMIARKVQAEQTPAPAPAPKPIPAPAPIPEQVPMFPALAQAPMVPPVVPTTPPASDAEMLAQTTQGLDAIMNDLNNLMNGKVTP